MTIMTGGEALITSLAKEGVEVIFGLPGVNLMAALDALYHQNQVRWLGVRHEQTTAYMAYGYARTTGKIGVAMVVPGPGALFAASALGTAYAASTPVLLISGQVESYNLGQERGALHEVVDQLEVFQNITKSRHCAMSVEEIPGAVQEAMHHLKTGRPRPVYLEIPWDIMDSSAEVKIPEPEPISLPQPEVTQIQAAAQLMASASRPIILAGGGIITSGASEELGQVAERLNAPVIFTRDAKGAIRDDHPFSLGSFYSDYDCEYGPDRKTLPEADVLLVVGSRLYRVPSVLPYGPNQKVIQIDVDAEEVGKNQALVHLGIISDARLALSSLLKELPKKSRSTWQPEEVNEIRKAVMAKLQEAAPLQLSIIRDLRNELSEDAILIPGGTNVGHWCNFAYPALQPRTYLTESYFGAIGWGFPTALGAKVGNPQKQVVVLSGDGGFMYALSELATAVQEGLNVVTLVFVDGAFGTCLHIQQQHFEGKVMGTRLHNPDFARLAESFGARGIKLSHPDELRDGLRSALAEDCPVVVEIPVPDMVPPWEMLLNP